MPGYEGHGRRRRPRYVRIVARLRERGHSRGADQAARARAASSRSGPIENLLRAPRAATRCAQAARRSASTPALIEQILAALGLAALITEPISDEDLEVLRYVATMLDVGLPPAALLQLARVYGQAMAQIADAEVRLFHLYVHEPLMREGVPSGRSAQTMEGMVREMLPFAVPFISYLHGRLLGHFIEQDVIGHIEADLDDGEPRRRAACAWRSRSRTSRATRA